MGDFTGKHIIVTGGSGGIGKAIAKDFFDRGATVLICARKKSSLNETCKEIDPIGKRFFGIVADVSKIKDCKKLVNFAIKKFKKIDVLINNAGTYGEIGELSIVNLENWRKTIETNLFGTVQCTRLVLPIMKKRKTGKIINFAGGGIGGKNPLPNFSAYYTSKIAIAGFTETVASELRNLGVNVNCISPGGVNTGITDYLISQGPKKAGEEIYKQALEQKKKGKSSMEDITNLVAFLSSSSSNHINGRLLSAKWDKIPVLKNLEKEGDLFKLRRIDKDLFYGK